MSSAAVRAADAFKAQIIAPTPDWSVLADNFVFESDEGSVGKAVFVEQIRALGGILVGTTTEDVVALPVGETVLFTVVKRFIGPKTRVNHVMARADGAGKMNRLFELPKTLPDQEAQTGALAFCRPLFDATLDALSAKGFEKCAADCRFAINDAFYDKAGFEEAIKAHGLLYADAQHSITYEHELDLPHAASVSGTDVITNAKGDSTTIRFGMLACVKGGNVSVFEIVLTPA